MRLSSDNLNAFRNLLAAYWTDNEQRDEAGFDLYRKPGLIGFAWPGGYPVAYYAGRDYQPTCAACANGMMAGYVEAVRDEFFRWAMGEDEDNSSYSVIENLADDVPLLRDCYYEGEPLPCEDRRFPECWVEIESAYGPVESAE